MLRLATPSQLLPNAPPVCRCRRGYSEVHAALAAVLYTERPALLDQAETQWEIAMEFNPKFSDPSWVAANKHWPPRLMTALDRFLNLK